MTKVAAVFKRAKKKNKFGHTADKAAKRAPVFGWDQPADVMTAQEYLTEAVKADPDFKLRGQHIAKLCAFGISHTKALKLLSEVWPIIGNDEKFAGTVAEQILQFYTDTPYPPGKEATGNAAQEINSDGQWDERWSKTKASVLKDWAWISSSMQFIHDDGHTMMNPKQFEMKYGRISPARKLLSQIERGALPMRRYIAQVYIPKAPPVLRYKGPPAMPFEGKVVFNLWRDSGMKPKAGDHKWFLDHVAKLFPDDAASQGHLIDYMAQLVQHPDVKIHFALLVQSVEGAGKGALARMLRRMIGDRNTVEPSNDEVTKAWTGWQECAQLAIVNELLAGGKAEVLNRLKSPITEDTLRVEKKFGNAFSIPNYLNFFCMTNFKNALPLTERDRRWLVLFSPLVPKESDKPYYAALFKKIADDKAMAAVLDFLLNHKINFNPKGHAPMTAAKLEMQERARTDVGVELHSWFELARTPFDKDVIRVDDIIAALRESRKNERGLAEAASKFLDDIGARRLSRFKDKTGKVPAFQLYAIRNHDEWSAKGAAEVARTYYHQWHYVVDGADDVPENYEWE